MRPACWYCAGDVPTTPNNGRIKSLHNEVELCADCLAQWFVMDAEIAELELEEGETDAAL